jgi:hypothetical protein
MPEISLSNSKGRDAQVMAESVRSPLSVRWVDDHGRQATSVRLLRGTLDRDAEALASQLGGLDKVSEALINGDPEIDIEQVGSFMRDTSRVFVNSDREIVHAVHQWDIVFNPDGSERQRRPKKISIGNVTPESPLRWSGKLMPKKDVFNKFVMASKLQIVHVNGLTYDFLFEMAKELETKNSLLLLGAGPKSNLPLILRRGATPYRGFLEGRTRGEQYCLLLHLSNMELKAPENTPEAEAAS